MVLVRLFAYDCELRQWNFLPIAWLTTVVQAEKPLKVRMVSNLLTQSNKFLCLPVSPVALYTEYSLSRSLMWHLISCVIQGSEGLLLIILVGMHSAIQASRASVKEVHSTYTDFPAWLAMNLPRKSIKRDLNCVQSALPKRCTFWGSCLRVVGFRRPSATTTSRSPRPGKQSIFCIKVLC